MTGINLKGKVATVGLNENSLPSFPATGSISNVPQEYLELVTQEIPIRRLTTTPDIASMVVFPASDLASDIAG